MTRLLAESSAAHAERAETKDDPMMTDVALFSIDYPARI
jgi:hypothetical protein